MDPDAILTGFSRLPEMGSGVCKNGGGTSRSRRGLTEATSRGLDGVWRENGCDGSGQPLA